MRIFLIFVFVFTTSVIFANELVYKQMLSDINKICGTQKKVSIENKVKSPKFENEFLESILRQNGYMSANNDNFLYKIVIYEDSEHYKLKIIENDSNNLLFEQFYKKNLIINKKKGMWYDYIWTSLVLGSLMYLIYFYI